LLYEQAIQALTRAPGGRGTSIDLRTPW